MYFKDDMAMSQKYFSMLKPDLEKTLKGNIIAVEGQNTALNALDIHAGIDYLVLSEKGIRGIASRIQVSKCYKTFTVRAVKDSGAKTELEKRVDAICDGYLYPFYTMQAYVCTVNGKLGIVYAVCRTKDIYDIIFKHPEKMQTRRTTNASFICVNWADVYCATRFVKM